MFTSANIILGLLLDLFSLIPYYHPSLSLKEKCLNKSLLVCVCARARFCISTLDGPIASPCNPFTNLTCTFSQKVGHSCSWNCRSSGFCCSQGHTTDFPQILYCSPCKKIQSVATPTLRALPTHRLLYVGLWLIVGKRVRRMSGRKLLYWQMEISTLYIYIVSLWVAFCICLLQIQRSTIQPLTFLFRGDRQGHWNPKLLWVYGSLACCDDCIQALSGVYMGVYMCVSVCDGSGWDNSPAVYWILSFSALSEWYSTARLQLLLKDSQVTAILNGVHCWQNKMIAQKFRANITKLLLLSWFTVKFSFKQMTRKWESDECTPFSRVGC